MRSGYFDEKLETYVEVRATDRIGWGSMDIFLFANAYWYTFS